MFRTLLLACSLFFWLFWAQGVSAYSVEDYDRCSSIENKEKRLQCYEEAAGRKPKGPVPDATPAPRPATPAAVVTQETPPAAPVVATIATGLARCKENYYSADRLRCYDAETRYSWWRCLTDCVWQTEESAAKKTDGVEACKNICDDSERLYAYDRLAGLNPKPPSQSSYLSKAWLLDPDSREKAGRWAIRANRDNYFLLYTYNGALDKQPYESVNPGTHLQNAETKFQLSLKLKLLEDIFEVFGKPVDIWAAYTQLSVWQLWNFNNSAPFRETNYEPELIANVRMNKELVDGWKLQFIQFVPLNHQSNGQSEPLSRSWNRTMVNFGFEKGNFDVVLKGWYRWPESAENDDNPSISSYLGYGELWAGYHGKACGMAYNLGLMLRNNLRFDDENRSTVQIGIDSTLVGPLNWYIQYFTGYGETLIDYNHYTNRIGLGVKIQDW